jgi:hypothetical protein
MPVSLYAVRRTAPCVAIVASAALVSVVAPAPLRAETSISLPLYDVEVPANERTQGPIESRGVAGQQFAVVPAAPGATASDTRPLLLPASSTSRFSVVELPPDAVTPGTYKRPHHGLGYRWSAAESWLRDRGLDAHTCYLPMVRMHTSVNRTGATGTLWLYGRCTFR